MAPITKFSYLKEFVELKVRKKVDGLPFTPEGYNRVKSILSDRYGKESEVVKAYVKDIIDLPTIAGVQPRKIHQFYERLLYDVQSLQTMGKLEHVNGNVTLTLYQASVDIWFETTRTGKTGISCSFVTPCGCGRAGIQ